MTSKVILYFIKDLRLYNFSNHRNFHQNQFINKYVRKKKAKISESRRPRVTEFFSEIYVEELTVLIKKNIIATINFTYLTLHNTQIHVNG